jgi:hypothetical protein
VGAMVEATTVGLVPRIAGQDLPIAGRAMAEVTTAAPAQLIVAQAATVIIVAVAGETMSAT